ncbi:MAG: hypothetical protein NTY13_06405 [Chlamydiae bacterium]|nr:hypothetical protein [Chlamydiota bacterium]
MQKQTLWALIFAIIFTVVLLLIYVNQAVTLTELRLELPKDSKELKELLEGNTSLQYEIERLENPARLMQLMHQPEFSHLQYPLASEVIILYNEPDN